MRQYALELINQDRAKFGFEPVVLGSNGAAQLHADDMLKHGYSGHWWSDGRKPYMVYSETGGTSYVSENVGWSGWSVERWKEENCDSLFVSCSIPDPQEAVEDLHWGMMYDDADSDWGHRDAILDENHRAVNIGVGFDGRQVVFVQHFEGGDAQVLARPSLSGDGLLSLVLLKNQAGLDVAPSVTLYHDPPPVPMSPEEIRALRSYCIGGGSTTRCGEAVAEVLKPLDAGQRYSGLEGNEVVADVWDEDEQSLTVIANLGDLVAEPGVYTVVVWRESGTTRIEDQLVALTLDRPDTTSASVTPTPSPTPSTSPRLTPTPESRPATTPTASPTPTPMPTATSAELRELQEYALELINTDRARNGVAPVTLGSNPAAQMHAEEMVEHDYFSRWWVDGRSTYMVYSATGGASYVRESIIWTGWREEDWQAANCASTRVRCDLSSPREVIAETHANRMSTQPENILDKGHRAVNTGIAFNQRWIVIVQHFEGGEVEADALPHLSSDGALSLSVSKASTDVEVAGSVGVYFDPLPTPKSPDSIDNADNYCTGEGFSVDCGSPAIRVLKPPATGRSYSNLNANDVVADVWDEDENSFSFSASLGELASRPGVYTVVIWRASDTTILTDRLLELSVVREE